MSCTEWDVRDYFLGELPERERLEAGRHIRGCEECGAELHQLQLMRGALGEWRDEEPPRRIGFVSDKVFEPSPVRRWLGSFWLSGARIGFVSSAMLSVALVVSAFHQPAPTSIERPVLAAAPQPDIHRLVNEAVAKAVAETQGRQDAKTRELLAAAEEKHEMAERALNAKLAVSFDMMEKRHQVLRASAMDFGGGDRP